MSLEGVKTVFTRTTPYGYAFIACNTLVHEDCVCAYTLYDLHEATSAAQLRTNR